MWGIYVPNRKSMFVQSFFNKIFKINRNFTLSEAELFRIGQK